MVCPLRRLLHFSPVLCLSDETETLLEQPFVCVSTLHSFSSVSVYKILLISKSVNTKDCDFVVQTLSLILPFDNDTDVDILLHIVVRYSNDFNSISV